MNIRDNNRKVMSKYKINQNVEIDFGHNKVVFATVVNFRENCFGEICVVFRAVQEDHANPPKMHVLNPGNSTFSITIL